MNPLIEQLTFDEAGKLATDGNEAARLYWMCLGRLSSTKEYATWHPGKVHDEIAKVAREVYDEQQAAAITGEATNDPQAMFPISSIVDYWVRNTAAARLMKEGLLQEYKFSCVLLNVPEPTASRIKEFARTHIPSEVLEGDGYEEKPHVTVKYGLHTTNFADVKKVIDGHGAVEVKMGRVRAFTDSPEHDVLVIEIISEQLRALNQLVSKLPHTDTFAIYKPHITLAYVKKGWGHTLAGNSTWANHPLYFREVVFTTPAGVEQKETLAESRVFDEGKMDIEITDGRPGSGPCELCGKMDETRFGICFPCFKKGTNESTVRYWFLNEEATPQELAEKPPVWIPEEMRPVWSHLVRTRNHTTYAGAIAHYKRHCFKHGIGETLSTGMIGATTARPPRTKKRPEALIAPIKGMGVGRRESVGENTELAFPDYHEVLQHMGFKEDGGHYRCGHQTVTVHRDGGWTHHGEGKGGAGSSVEELINHLQAANGEPSEHDNPTTEAKNMPDTSPKPWTMNSRDARVVCSGCQKMRPLAGPCPRCGTVREDLQRICAWCKKDMGKTKSEHTGETHGACPSCLKNLMGQVKNGLKTEATLNEDDYEMGSHVKNIEGISGVVIHIHNYGTAAEAYVVRHGTGQIGLYSRGELMPFDPEDQRDAQAHLDKTGHPMGRSIPADDDLRTE